MGTSETHRLAVLAEYGIESAPTRAFDRITALAIAAFRVPTALVTIVAEKRQWFKSRVGFDRPETPIEIAFCARTIKAEGVLVIEDAMLHPEFCTNELVTGPPHVRFYAGAAVRAATGEALGSVAILDVKPRRLDEAEIALLEALARLAGAEMALWHSHGRSSGDPIAEAARRMRAADVDRERALATLVRNSHDVITLVDEDMRVLEVSPSVQQVLGYTPAEYLATTFRDAVHPDDVTLYCAAFTRVTAQTGASTQMTYRHRHADGSYRVLEVFAENLLDVEPIRAVVAHARDITPRVTAEQAVRERLRQQTALADLGRVVVRDGTDIPSAAAETVAYAVTGAECVFLRPDETGTRLSSIASAPASREVALEIDALYREAESIVAVDLHEDARFVPLRALGRRYAAIAPIAVRARLSGAFVVVRDEPFDEGDVQLVIGVANLVSAKLAEEAAREEILARERELRLAEKMEALGRLALGIAHDVNNVFAAVWSLAESLISSLEPGSTQQQDAQALIDAARRGAAMTKQIVAFARPARNEPTDVDLGDLVRRVTTFLRRTLGADVRVDLELEPSLPLVRGDIAQLEQVLLNLCTNARDAMGGVGTVNIALCNASDGVELSVSDSGCGMSPGVLSRIFEPFYTTKTHDRGAGIGLATTHAIIKQHGGRIAVQSVPGRGTRFVIHLPAVPRSNPPAAASEEDAVKGRGELILVADDDEAVRSTTARLLESAGYRVVQAVDGIDAYAKFRAHADELAAVILDATMPRANGAEALARIQAERANVPYLFCSGSPMSDDPNVIVKPFRADELLRQLRKRVDLTDS